MMVLAASTFAIVKVVERSREVGRRLDRGEDVGWWDQNEVQTQYHTVEGIVNRPLLVHIF